MKTISRLKNTFVSTNYCMNAVLNEKYTPITLVLNDYTQRI